jgi:hypothetical protein
MLHKIIRGLFRVALVILGLLMIGIGGWIGHGQNRLLEGFESGFAALHEAASAGFPSVSPDSVDQALDGQVVYLQGPLEHSPVSDPLTGVTLAAGGLRRTVEMYQWTEHIKSGGSGTRTTSTLEFEYRPEYRSKLINSDNFQAPPIFGEGEEHINPKTMPHDNMAFIAPDLRIGAWQLAESYAWRVASLRPVPEDVLAEALTSPDWEVADGAVQRRHQTWDIGAVRLKYEYLPVAEGNYSVIGIARDGRLDDDLFKDVIGPPLIEAGNVDPEQMVASAETYAYEGDLTKNWISWIFFGILLSLRTLARPFGFLRRFTDAPAKRRWPITIGIAAFLTVATAILI